MLKSSPSIVVIGSANVDMVARAPHLPKPGETVMGDSFTMVPGGKGANQAVAAARLGAKVAFVGRVGDDAFGASTIDGLRAEGIDTAGLLVDTTAPTGVALIGVSSTTGENCIIVVAGANGNVSIRDVEKMAGVIAAANVVVAQLEVPIDVVIAAFHTARAAGATTILNPAPAQALPEELMRLTSVLTPNEEEARTLSGLATGPIADVAADLRRRGPSIVVITMGAAGVYVDDGVFNGMMAGRKVEMVVDTTAAGDCFTGALAVSLGEGTDVADAVRFANSAAALSVTQAAAQPSLPTRSVVERFQSGGGA